MKAGSEAKKLEIRLKDLEVKQDSLEQVNLQLNKALGLTEKKAKVLQDQNSKLTIELKNLMNEYKMSL